MVATRALLIVGPRCAGQSSALAACHHYGWQTMGHVPAHQVADCLNRAEGNVAFTVAGLSLADWEAWTAEFPQLQGLYLDADTDVLVQRVNLSDGLPPANLTDNATEYTTVQAQVLAEQAHWTPFKKQFTFSLDTGDFTPDAFRYKMGQILGFADAKPPGLQLSLWSFGFKYGVPLEANWVFDVRFIPNPFYQPDLRPLTGMDLAIQQFVMGHEVAQGFVTHTAALISQAAPLYPQQGIDRLVVAIGCTGGKHRSVTLVETLAEQLRPAYPGLQVLHREQLSWKRPAIAAIG